MYELPYYRIIAMRPLAQAPPPIPYGVKMIGAELEWPETRGKGVKVAVVDTGIAPHPDLKIAGFFDATAEGAAPRDLDGHGTHCAGILAANGKIKGVAPEVSLYGVRIFDDKGRASEDSIIRSLKWCLDHKMDVVSMSFGTPQQPSASMKNVIQQLYAQGTILVAAAGNYGQDYPRMFPAAYPEVISVAAVDVEKRHAQWSSRHETVELSAAGVEVWSTYLGGGYALLNGTSMACPHIAGAAALMKGKARIRGKKDGAKFIRYAMGIYADDLGEKGRDKQYGFGLFSFGRIIDGQPAPDRPAIDLVFKIGQRTYWKNGQEQQAYARPLIIFRNPMLGLRDVGEAFGAEVEWIPPRTVNIRG